MTITKLTAKQTEALAALKALGESFNYNFRHQYAHSDTGSADVSKRVLEGLEAKGHLTWNPKICRFSVR